MGPFLGPYTAALLAALVAGTALGLTRLSRLSLEWWRRRRAGAAGAPAEDAEPEATADAAAPAAFPGVHGAIACALSAAALIAIAAIGRSFPAGPGAPATLPSIALHPFNPVTFVPRALAALGFAAAALAGTVALALVSALLDRALGRALAWAFARVRIGAARAATEATLSLADLRAGATGLWGGAVRAGEPYGVGVGYVALFVTPVAAVALLGALALPQAAPARGAVLPREAWLLFGVLFLAVPAAYAAAAERSQREDGARLRRRAALRQLVAAPAWALGLLLLGLPGGRGAAAWALPAWILLAVSVPLALPGTTGARALLVPPRGGDAAEPSAALRALTGLAHHGWLAAWAAFAAFTLVPASRPGWLLLALGAVLASTLAARALGFAAWRRA